MNESTLFVYREPNIDEMVRFENLFPVRKAWLKRGYLLRTSNQPIQRRRTCRPRGVQCDTLSWLQESTSITSIIKFRGSQTTEEASPGAEGLGGRKLGMADSLETNRYYFTMRLAHKWRKIPRGDNADLVIGLMTTASSEMCRDLL